MDILYALCCGFVVHKTTVTACLGQVARRGRMTKEVRTVRMTTGELLALDGRLVGAGCIHVAMESIVRPTGRNQTVKDDPSAHTPSPPDHPSGRLAATASQFPARAWDGAACSGSSPLKRGLRAGPAAHRTALRLGMPGGSAGA
jgi:hypothetical protein